MTYLCGLNASSCLSDSILRLEQSETSANIKTPLLSHCQCCPLGFSAVSWSFDSSLSYHHTLGAPDTCMHGSDGYWHLNFQIDEQVWSEDFFVDPMARVIRYQEQLFSSCSENKITPQYVLRHVSSCGANFSATRNTKKDHAILDGAPPCPTLAGRLAQCQVQVPANCRPFVERSGLSWKLFTTGWLKMFLSYGWNMLELSL